ncbi:SRPBCC family protein [Streptomyces sp. NPDC006967]|uniref:SRPBCC family protein n=1 Tax=unclassified Streptomyces TaxID=2593676 RepID=UPI000CD4BA3F|nr:SRPBCC family protein [Streptomyces sp. SM1]
MAETTTSETADLFQVSAETSVHAAPTEVYTLISDMPRSAEWSPECQGGIWVEGEPATAGAVFRGENVRSADVVAWAPVVRGRWTTYAEVVAAEPGRTFRWAMRDSAGRRQESVWGFDIAPAPEGSLLVHHFRMGRATEGIRGITAGMDGQARQRFFTEWSDKLQHDLTSTLQRIKAVIEQH